MTDLIRAALEALDKATPGPWVVGGKYTVRTTKSSSDWICRVRDIHHRHSDEEDSSNATLIAAAPDMAAEIVKLRKWQSEALPYIEERYGIDLNQIEALEMEVPEWETSPGYRAVMNGCKERVPQLDRLIAEAKEATND